MRPIILKPLKMLAVLAFIAATTTACVEEAELNTDSAEYTPETRKVDVIAGEGGEFTPGNPVSVQGRLVGSAVNGESIIWEQTAGAPVEAEDWTASPLVFIAPEVEGIENLTFTITGLDANGNVLQRDVEDEEGNMTTEPMMATVSITIFDPASLITFEVEDTSVATLDGVALTSEGQDQFISGAVGSHTRDFTPGNSALFTLDTAALERVGAGYYTLYARYAIPASGYGSKGTVVTVNGVPYEFMVPATGSWDNYRVGIVSFAEGVNTIEIGGGWNYYRLDSISLIPAAPPAAPLPVSPALVNEAPIPEATALMEFLTQNYGLATLSGQTEFMNYGADETGLREFDKIVSATGGDAPAIVAFDFMDYSASRVDCGADPGTLSEDMIAAHQSQNVILSALWHWNAPMHLVDDSCSSSTSGEAWWHGFYSTATTFDLAAALADESSDEYASLIADIDAIAAELQKFEDAGIPILWRPLHEAEGAWFWWGNAGADALKSLWILMFERLSEFHDLDNLIWIFTHAGDLDTAWYPGDAYVDIVGYDGYDANNRDNPFLSQYSTLKNRFNGKKLVALTETGTIPNVENMHASEAWWSFFITWNSGGDYGPDGQTEANIAASYAFEGVLNLADIPGGRIKYAPGVYENFEIAFDPWHAQVNWATVEGTQVSDTWSTAGLHALSIVRDLSAETEPTSVVFQAYPEGGIDVSEVNTLTLSANIANAGINSTAKLFIKHGDDWLWVDGGAQAGVGGVELSLDVSEYDWLAGLGVQFEGFDAASTAAEFYIDKIMLDGSLLYDFEPATGDWGSQINWANTYGQSISSAWSTEGARALSFTRDLSAVGGDEPTGVMFQIYPADGFDVSDISTLTLDVNALDAGAAATGKLFIKHGDDWLWVDSGAVAAVGGTTLSIDVSAYDWLAGFGVQFENFDSMATAAAFYLDNIRFDDALYEGFEGTGAWDFQVNWSSVPGAQLSNAWTVDGNFSLAGSAQLVDGDNDIILQTYPEGGILLDGVSSLAVSAYGEATNVMLWAKDKDGTWRDGGAVAMADGGVILTLDISDLDELQGFGVRFMDPTNTATPSSFFIDAISFE